ncbi:hypothetical protein ES695_14780 [Candidatus Atribacteria bacterium 1244-E10-H5-B2]|nr:MAG: hypothetical protein ES695_14780 [Candidatus Atribacteria bacterium 1244-E10-H5-B2]
MAKKWRSTESHLGNTAEARERQRANLIPGNSWYRRKTKGLRLDCFWGVMPLKDRQDIFEAFENRKDLKEIDNMPEEELKDKKYLAEWWSKQELEDKKFIYKNEMTTLAKESVSWLLKGIEKCLKKKLALLEKT